MRSVWWKRKTRKNNKIKSRINQLKAGLRHSTGVLLCSLWLATDRLFFYLYYNLNKEKEMDLQMKVAQAVHVLNHDTQSCNRVAANQWLVQFQQTDAVWEVATSILTSDHLHLQQQTPPPPFVSDLEVEFFAAQILKRKVCSISLPWILQCCASLR